jgi:hypothetical protein
MLLNHYLLKVGSRRAGVVASNRGVRKKTFLSMPEFWALWKSGCTFQTVTTLESDLFFSWTDF